MICKLQKLARTVQVAHILLFMRGRKQKFSLQMGNAEDTDELIGITGSGYKHLTVQLRIGKQCTDARESGKILKGPCSQNTVGKHFDNILFCSNFIHFSLFCGLFFFPFLFFYVLLAKTSFKCRNKEKLRW